MSRSQPESESNTLQPTAAEIGQRLDRMLLSRFPELSRRTVGLAIAEGRVLLNGRRAKKAMAVGPGDRIELRMPTSFAVDMDTDTFVEACYLDDHLLVVNKPAGMPCHGLRPGESNTVVAALVARFPELVGVGDDPREPGLVHRLDTDTSGLLLLARSPAVWQNLRALLRAGAIDKTYVARCAPLPSAPKLLPGVHSAFLRANRGARVRVSHDPLDKASRAVATEILSTTRLPDGTILVRARIRHAARHQVRAHLSHLGHPLVGDLLYGGPPSSPRHLLHAESMNFVHPVYNTPIKIAAEAPAEFLEPLRLP